MDACARHRSSISQDLKGGWVDAHAFGLDGFSLGKVTMILYHGR